MVVLIWVVIIGAIFAGLFVWGRKLQGQYEQQQELINQHKQSMQIFVIDKKKDTLDNLKIPKYVKEQIPKRQQKRKVPVIIAKVGPQVQTLLCDDTVYDVLPVKKQVKVEMAGVLVVNVLNNRLPEPEKQGMRVKLKKKLDSLRKQADEIDNKSK